MSKKTEQIYKAISSLEDLQNQISIINQIAKGQGREDEQAHHLQNIEFEMAQQLKSLRFWISSLYSYNGKSTSRAKQAASKENGKKGGRPPKEITMMKKRREELDLLIEESQREKIVTTDFEKEEKLIQEIAEYEHEKEEITRKLQDWDKIKKSSALFAE